MGRILGVVERNEMVINDNLSGGDLVLYYRTPTASERLQYSNKSIQRVRDKIVFRHGEVRQEYGAKILTGFRDGDFKRMKDGVAVAISTDPKSPDYFEGWKALVCEYAADAIEMLSIFVFEGSVAGQRPEPEDETTDTDEPAGLAVSGHEISEEDAAGNLQETSA